MKGGERWETVRENFSGENLMSASSERRVRRKVASRSGLTWSRLNPNDIGSCGRKLWGREGGGGRRTAKLLMVFISGSQV